MSPFGCENLEVHIADITVVRDLVLELACGEFWGLLGPNGIGKTTLLKCLAGLTPPATGRVLLESRDIAELPRKLLARHIGMLQQHTVYVFDSSVMQTALTLCTRLIWTGLQTAASPSFQAAKPGDWPLRHCSSRNRKSCYWMNPPITST